MLKLQFFLTESFGASLEIRFNEDLTRDRNGRAVSFRKEVLEKVNAGEYLYAYCNEIEERRSFEKQRQEPYQKTQAEKPERPVSASPPLST